MEKEQKEFNNKLVKLISMSWILIAFQLICINFLEVEKLKLVKTLSLPVYIAFTVYCVKTIINNMNLLTILGNEVIEAKC